MTTKLMKKIYKEPKLETAAEIKKQAIIDEEKFIKTELEAKIVDFETSKEAKIKGIKDFFDEVKKEEVYWRYGGSKNGNCWSNH